MHEFADVYQNCAPLSPIML